MNVLSLFDGISCGQVALEKAGIKVDKYFASEINKHAILVTQNNYPQTIQIGDASKINYNDYKIDLLLGGSPCQSFSNAGKREGFDGKSKLFFEFVRALNECRPKWFIFENVNMKKEWQDIISKHLGVEPIPINSNLLSAQNRKRLYWTNIPMEHSIPYKNIMLRDILEANVDLKYYVENNGFIKIAEDNGDGNKAGYFRKDCQANRVYYSSGKAVTLCGDAGGGAAKMGQYFINGKIRKLTPIECERLQTLPDNYTSILQSESQRYKCLGNGWTVDVIAYILKGLVING